MSYEQGWKVGHDLGKKLERERIIKLLEQTPFIWMGEKQFIQTSRDELIALIKGEN